MSSDNNGNPQYKQGPHDGEARFQIFELFNYPVSVVGTDGNLLYGNSLFRTVFDTSKNSIKLQPDHPFYSEYRKRLANAYLGALEGNERQCFAVILSNEGDKIPVEIYLFPMLENGVVISILSIFRNVDNRMVSFNKSTLSLLSDESSTYEDVLYQFTPMPVIRINSESVILRRSHTFENFAGLTLNFEDCHNTILTFFPFDHERIRAIASRLSGGELPFARKGELKFISADASEKIVNIVMYPVIDAEHGPLVEIAIEDVTEVKSLKEKINSIGRNNLLQDITKGFLHSLNNSINIVLSQTQLLQQITEKPSVLEGISIIEKSSLDIIDDIRRLQNSISAKPSMTGEQPEHLVSIIEDSIEFARLRFKVEDRENRRNIAIEKKYYSSPEIMTDASLLREILISIILKISGIIRSNGTVTLTMKETSDVVINVTAQKQDAATDGFQRSNLVNVFSGIDIRQSSEKIGLKIFEEESNSSYSIKVIIPERRLLHDRLKSGGKTEYVLRNLNILIVEDELTLQKILRDLFDRMGNHVRVCSNSSDALEEIKANRFDILITDYGIPGLTGIELAARAKELNDRTATFLLSGWTMDDIDAYSNVIDVFIPKPFKLDELIQTISKTMKEKTKNHGNNS